MATKLRQLCEAGQSPWIDSITRALIRSGDLQRLVERGVRGLTANPTIFERAIIGSADYDAAIGALAADGAGSARIYEELLLDDIRDAADVLRPVYDQSGGADGYASIEVSPALADDTQATIAEARRYARAVGHPNVFVKVPATDAGIPAIRQLIGEGINVNITLIFAIESYERVMDAYLGGLEQLVADGQPLNRVASVASFFVSRVDGAVDRRLGALLQVEQDPERRGEMERLLGNAAIANARIAYQRFLSTFSGERFEALRRQGAHVQRPLWASTSTKNPRDRDVMYVEELIGPDTVTTMPPATIEAFEDHGRIARTIDHDVAEAYGTIRMLQELGISMKDVTDTLQVEGVQLFAASLDRLDRSIREKGDAQRARRDTGTITRTVRV